MERRGPRGGYDFHEKRAYRSAVWSHLTSFMSAPKAKAQVLILPSVEGAEIPLLLSLGFQARHIHAVDENPALIATAPWRKEHPEVRAYGNALPRALERMAEAGVRLEAVNIDLCSSFSTPVVEVIDALVRTRVLADEAAVAMTLLKGRETKATIAALRLAASEGAFSDHRMSAAFSYLARNGFSRVRGTAEGEYRSGTQTMTWAAARVCRVLDSFSSDEHLASIGASAETFYPVFSGWARGPWRVAAKVEGVTGRKHLVLWSGAPVALLGSFPELSISEAVLAAVRWLKSRRTGLENVGGMVAMTRLSEVA